MLGLINQLFGEVLFSLTSDKNLRNRASDWVLSSSSMLKNLQEL